MGKGSRLGAVAPLITAFADEVFDCAERLSARMPNRRLDPPLLGLLDEAPSIAPVPTLPELVADGRGRGIVIVYAMQSFSQAVTKWGAQKAETMGNATSITAVLGGLTSPSDLADLERICGQRRVRRVSTHRGRAAATAWTSHAPSVGRTKRSCGPTRYERCPPVSPWCSGAGCHRSWPAYRCFLRGPIGRMCSERRRWRERPMTVPAPQPLSPPRHYPDSEGFPGGEVFPATTSFPDGPVPIPATSPARLPS